MAAAGQPGSPLRAAAGRKGQDGNLLARVGVQGAARVCALFHAAHRGGARCAPPTGPPGTHRVEAGSWNWPLVCWWLIVLQLQTAAGADQHRRGSGGAAHFQAAAGDGSSCRRLGARGRAAEPQLPATGPAAPSAAARGALLRRTPASGPASACTPAAASRALGVYAEPVLPCPCDPCRWTPQMPWLCRPSWMRGWVGTARSCCLGCWEAAAPLQPRRQRRLPSQRLPIQGLPSC
jgi:hypothetical protein